jgi:phosphoesterase RecJ-like protein
MNDYQDISHQIKNELEQAQDILIISHKKPDGDTLGSNFALASYLKDQNKNVTSFCLDPMSEMFYFLHYSYTLTTDHLIFTKKYDVVILVDSASLPYAGVNGLLTALPKGYKLINIDHHASNDYYGDINLVIDSTASCTEIIHRLFNEWKINWTPEIATALICGIITDTGGFTNPATNYRTLESAAHLINQGANINQVTRLTLFNQNIHQLKLWGRALSRLTKNKRYDLVYTHLTQKDFLECEVPDTASEGIANFLYILKEAQVIMVIKETDNGLIKGSLRTTSDEIDLTKIAALMGGGGHKKASGFALPGRLAYDNNKLRVI